MVHRPFAPGFGQAKALAEDEWKAAYSSVLPFVSLCPLQPYASVSNIGLAFLTNERQLLHGQPLVSKKSVCASKKTTCIGMESVGEWTFNSVRRGCGEDTRQLDPVLIPVSREPIKTDELLVS